MNYQIQNRKHWDHLRISQIVNDLYTPATHPVESILDKIVGVCPIPIPAEEWERKFGSLMHKKFKDHLTKVINDTSSNK